MLNCADFETIFSRIVMSHWRIEGGGQFRGPCPPLKLVKV